jgi:probable HAF family extracellular repeat protein
MKRLALILLLITLAACAWASYTTTDLGTLPGDTQSAALDINRSGKIVGFSSSSDGRRRAVVWQGGVISELSLPGATKSCACAINDRGQIAGWMEDETGWHSAFIWTGGKVTSLGTLGGKVSEATDIDESGTVVGWSADRFGSAHAFIYKNGAMKELIRAESWAEGIAGGKVVGLYHGKFGYSAFVWQNGLNKDLMPAGGGWSQAEGISPGGDVVGYVDSKKGETYAVLWRAGKPTRLAARGCTDTHANGVNGRGVIVGSCTNGVRRASVWQAGSHVHLATPTPGAAAEAYRVNDAGQIVGIAAGRATLWRPSSQR